MITISPEQSFKLAHVFRRAIEQALFVQHQHAKAITGIQ